MSAPFGHFRPGQPGFIPGPPPRVRRPLAILGFGWGVLMLVAAIVMLGLLLRLTHHQPRTPTLRPTIAPASWIPAPLHEERAFARLEQTEEHP